MNKIGLFLSKSTIQWTAQTYNAGKSEQHLIKGPETEDWEAK